MKTQHNDLLITSAEGRLQEVYVDSTYYPGSSGARDSLGGRPGCGPSLEPDTPPEIVINTVSDTAGRILEPTLQERLDIEEQLFNLRAQEQT